MAAQRSIARLPDLIAGLPPADRELFQRLFRLTVSEARLRAPPSMHGWLEERFGGVAGVERQTVVRVANLWTLEETVFNPLRARRPKGTTPARPRQRRGDDPLDRPLELTPEDVFGRIQGQHCLTTANVAKAESWHSLIVFHDPDPMAFTADTVADCLETARRWWRAAHERDSEAVYPLLFWNCGVTAGASLNHAHVQVILARERHFGGIERLRAAAEEYRTRHGSDYFRDLVRAHALLGAAFTYEGAAVLASLTPVKEREVVIISPALEAGLAGALYKALACYRDRFSLRSFNLALFGPAVGGGTEEDWHRFPFVARLVERPGPSEVTSDIGAMEMFAAAIVSHDPFELAEALAASLAGPP